jgi:hypothetical protein
MVETMFLTELEIAFCEKKLIDSNEKYKKSYRV